MFSGLAGAGALDELERLVLRQQREEQLREQARARRTQEEFNRKQFESIDKDREERREFTRQQRAAQEDALKAAGEAAGDQRRARSNISGLMLMRGQLPPDQLQNEVLAQAVGRDVDLDPAVREAIKPQLRREVVPGPGGRAIAKMVPEDAEVEVYEKPDRPPRTDLTPGEVRTQTRMLRNDYTRQVGQLRELRRQSAIMDAGLKAAEAGDLAAGSQAVLVTFQKILDPTSVVRESEYARSASGQSALNQIEGAYERVLRGGAGIPLDELKRFADLAKTFVQRGAVEERKLRDHYREMATDFGLNPKHIVGEDETGEAGPVIGERRSINGRLAEWDGKGWKAVR